MTFHDRSRIGEEHPMVRPKYNFLSLDFYRHLSISSSIIEEAKALHKTGFGLTAYYYFDFIDAPKQDIRGLLSSLIAQLSAKSDLCYKILSDLYSKHDSGSLLPDDEALTQCLKEMLDLPGQPPIYIIIDALDECPNTPGAPSPRELVLDLIEELVTRPLNLRICITSRPEADIQEVLAPLVAHSVSLHDEAGQQQDIMEYIASAVQSDRKMRKWRTGDRELVIDTLSRRADGMYVFEITVSRRFAHIMTGFDGSSAK